MVNNAVGRYVKAALTAWGVSTDYCRMLENDGNFAMSLAIAEVKAQNPEVNIYRRYASDICLAQQDIDAINFDQAAILLITGTSLSAEAAFAAVSKAKQAGVITVVDIDYRMQSWQGDRTCAHHWLNQLCQQAEVICGNDEEFALLASGTDDSYAMADGRELAQSMATSGAIAIYKMGEKGGVCLTKNETIIYDIFSTQVLKPYGAGDAFLGNTIAALAQGYDLNKALNRGSAAAALVVSRFGCGQAMPNLITLDDFIGQNS